MRTLPSALRAPLLFAPLVVLLLGCSTRYEAPPTVESRSLFNFDEPASPRTIVIGEFENPKRASVRWRDIGEGMSEALALALINREKFDVRIDDRLARRVQQLLREPIDTRRASFDQIRKDYEGVRIIVTGEVTDFAHTNDLPEHLQRRDWYLFGRKREAIVALQLNVFDLERGRLMSSEHLVGTANAPEMPPRELYDDVSFGSYIFWSTPLGDASETAIDKAIAVLRRSTPARDGAIRIVRQTSPRDIELSGGRDDAVERGQRYYICRNDRTTGALTAVRDPDTDLALEIQVRSVSERGATAWLIGRKPVDVDLRGAELRSTLPTETPIVTTDATTPIDGE